MKFILKHPYQLDSVNGVQIEDDVARIRWSRENKVFSRNIFVTINVKGSKIEIYRILKGASTENDNDSEVLVSCSSFKYLQAKVDAELQIAKSTFREKNVLFYFSHPDFRKDHQVIRDFVVSFAAFVVSIVEIFRCFGLQP